MTKSDGTATLPGATVANNLEDKDAFSPIKPYGNLEEGIYAFILEFGNVSFVELCGRFGCGDFGIFVMPNLIIWTRLPEEVAEILVKLKSEGKIKYTPCGYLLYVLDGLLLPYPIATRIPEVGFKTLTWLPVVINVVG